MVRFRKKQGRLVPITLAGIYIEPQQVFLNIRHHEESLNIIDSETGLTEGKASIFNSQTESIPRVSVPNSSTPKAFLSMVQRLPTDLRFTN